jgi:putative CocE/NonD family hydrolase
MNRSKVAALVVCAAMFGAPVPTVAQELVVPASAWASDSAFTRWLPQLARQLVGNYREADHARYLDNLARMHLAAGDFAAGLQALDALRALRAAGDPTHNVATLAFEIYAVARSDSGDAIRRAFAARVRPLADRAAFAGHWVLQTPLFVFENALQRTIEEARSKQSLDQRTAVTLIRLYAALQATRALAPQLAKLLEEDDARRYIVMRDVLVPSVGGGQNCVIVVRPRKGPARQPALLQFSVYASDFNEWEARRTAANGYVGVEGMTRGKRCSPNQPLSHEYDGADAAAVIDWISMQPWSDGRVGMYGGSYNGFTQWSAAKRMPKALKAMMPSVTHVPGIDFPMDGGVFANYAYPWPFFTMNNKLLDSATYNDAARWNRMNKEWYRSGRAYRDLPLIDGTPNPVWAKWIAHTTFDAYWKGMTPYRAEFARIDIPVLTTTGYYDGGMMGALWTFREHHKYHPRANHTLLIGPYDHPGGQRGTMNIIGRVVRPELRGYAIDSIAHLDIAELRYQWFNHVFKGAAKPALLKDKVNFQVMGANEWKHASSLEAMSETSLRVQLPREVKTVVNLADRSDVDSFGEFLDSRDPSSDARDIITTAANIDHAIEFASEPFTAPANVSGLFKGQVSFVTNKNDFDFSVALFEKTSEGKYFQLSWHWQRASFAHDREKRRLFTPRQPITLPFHSNRLTSKRIAAGSRVVVVIAVIKNPTTQINYGTGGDVNLETIADAEAPLEIRWLHTTYVDVPVSKSAR